ncbi:MAG: hypothetical protein Kilf2KO_42130 [Rhodospirillales bacterium]
MAQLVMVAHILVAKSDGEDALPYQSGDVVRHSLSAPAILEAGGETVHQADGLVGRTKQ